MLKLEAKIDALSQGYMSDENKQQYIAWLEDPNTKIKEHEGRHIAVKTLGCSYYYRYNNGWKDLTDDQRHDKLQEWNQQRCIPPLLDKEFSEIWKWIISTHRKSRDELHEKKRDAAILLQQQKEKQEHPLKMPGCIYYQINSNPDKYIVGTADYKLVEIERRPRIVDQRSGLIINSLITNKAFTACKPVRIVKHQNPLSFLELQQRYTIEFKGPEASGNFIIKHKTISEIVSELKNGNALCENGIDVAITAQIKGFEKAGSLEVNDDMNYTGFFTNESNSQIIPSGIEISVAGGADTTDMQKLRVALEYINELVMVGYPNRLDLLAHTILFGLIAPCSFIFKVIKAPTLEWMHLYGKPNASKSTSGRIILAMDGHEQDDDCNVNMAHVDTIARFGDTISVTTFPKLVDEMDFTDNKTLVNLVKSAIDQPRLRKVMDRSRRAEYIPALSAFIMTSNPPPPLHDGALMKRMAARYFPDTETHLKDEQASRAFDALLLSQLDKLHKLGHFRNRFVMDNQQLILDKKLTPFEKARKIVIAAYESAEMLAPGWLMTKQLEQKHLEESIIDNKEAVLVAFRAMLIDKMRILKSMDKEADDYVDDTARFMNLAARNILPFVRLLKDRATKQPNGHGIINIGILTELYNYGITKEQLPTLKALADYMGAKYRISEGRNVIDVSKTELEAYFGVGLSELSESTGTQRLDLEKGV